MNCFKELHNSQDQKLAMAGVIVEEIRASIYKETGFRCSAGIAQNKVIDNISDIFYCIFFIICIEIICEITICMD